MCTHTYHIQIHAEIISTESRRSQLTKFECSHTPHYFTQPIPPVHTMSTCSNYVCLSVSISLEYISSCHIGNINPLEKGLWPLKSNNNKSMVRQFSIIMFPSTYNKNIRKQNISDLYVSSWENQLTNILSQFLSHYDLTFATQSQWWNGGSRI